MSATRRQAGTGNLTTHRDRAGRETWYGKFRAGGRQVKRCIGPKRPRGSADGLTKRQAEAELRRLMDEARSTQPLPRRTTLDEAGDRYIVHIEQVMGRKPSTVKD